MWGSPGTINVEALAVASPADTFRFERSDSIPFPAVFSEEVQPYLSPGRGISSTRRNSSRYRRYTTPRSGDMVSSLFYRIKQDDLLSIRPLTILRRLYLPSSDSPSADDCAFQAASRVLRGKGATMRALALYRSLCRKGHAGADGPFIRPFLQPGLSRRRGLILVDAFSPGLRTSWLSVIRPPAFCPAEGIPSLPG